MSIPYATAVHLCACGCGNKVVTPFSPAEWQLTYDGDTVSLSPSIGNWQFPCKSQLLDQARCSPVGGRLEQGAGGRRTATEMLAISTSTSALPRARPKVSRRANRQQHRVANKAPAQAEVSRRTRARPRLMVAVPRNALAQERQEAPVVEEVSASLVRHHFRESPRSAIKP